ncbi:MAG: glycosyltransferase family 39 protein [Phycisphaeraceae bacterium]|nr:glycosyltransferase family 39 protein [Phycisphaeraceae bacterium]
MRSAGLSDAADVRAAGRLLAILTLLNCLAWFGLSVLAFNPPLDVVEMLMWGRDPAWGYAKHPPLVPVLADLAYRAAGGAWGVHLLSQVFGAAAVWGVWSVARCVLPAREALLAGALTLAAPCVTDFSAEFNNNVGLVAAWSVSCAAYFHAMRTGRVGWWLLLGAAMGAGVLCKYTALMLAAPLGVHLLATLRGRAALATAGPWAAVLVAGVIVAPHAAWLVEHGWAPIHYASERARGVPGLAGRMLFAGELAAMAAAMSAVALVALLPRLRREADGWVPTSAVERPDDRGLVVWMWIGPIVLHAVVCLALGWRMRFAWTVPLALLAAPALMLLIRRDPIADGAMRRWAWAVAGAAWLGQAAVQALTGTSLASPDGRMGREQLPAGDLALRARELTGGGEYGWVVGPWWVSASVALHLEGRPRVYDPVYLENAAPAIAARMAAEDRALVRRIAAEGAMVIWPAAGQPGMLHGPHVGAIVVEGSPPTEVSRRWPGVRVLGAVEAAPWVLRWWPGQGALPPVRLWVGVVNPGSEVGGPWRSDGGDGSGAGIDRNGGGATLGSLGR